MRTTGLTRFFWQAFAIREHQWRQRDLSGKLAAIRPDAHVTQHGVDCGVFAHARAALSLSRLWRQQGKRDAAQACLAPVYHSFAEGFDTANLQAARRCLAAIGATV